VSCANAPISGPTAGSTRAPARAVVRTPARQPFDPPLRADDTRRLMSNHHGSKVVIVGAGLVGSTFAYALMINGVASEIVMIDVNEERLVGEVMDLNHGMSFVRPVTVRVGTYDDCADAAVVVLTAGANQKPGETRIDLLARNTAIFKDIVGKVKATGTGAILLVATNPVDVMTHITLKLSGFSPERVIGSGTVLDSSRLRFLLGRHCRVDTSNVHAYVIGEHGDSEVPVWSLANIAGVRVAEYYAAAFSGSGGELRKKEIFNEVRDSAYRIIKGKGATYYAIGLALTQIVETLIRDERSVLTVSSLLRGEYGLSDVCLSLPSIVSRDGIVMRIELGLAPDEAAGLRNSAAVLKELQAQLEI
jgi:L-lactate dehydrogenase